jgi:hypothetical protein
MRPEEIRKLLGGYATGTLTEAEREALFAAALEDQDLFDELAREQPLHDLLHDPTARAELLAAVTERPKTIWAWWRPAAAALAVAGVAGFALLLPRKKALEPAPAAPPAIVAEVKPAPPLEVPPVEIPAVRKREAAPSKPRPKTFQPPPAPPAAPPPLPSQDGLAVVEMPKTSAPAGVAGGTPGGVVGGVIGGYLPPVPVPAPTARNSFAPSTTQSVMVTAEAAPVPQQNSARTIFFGTRPARFRVRASAVTDAAAVQRELGVRYSIVRKEGALWAPIDPESITKSDEVSLRFTSNVNGYLSLAGGEPVALTAMEPYITPALDRNAGEIRVIFALTPQTAVAAPVALATEIWGSDVFVVNTMPGMPLGFTIALKRK